jgi:CRP-like cAMP-binding protein
VSSQAEDRWDIAALPIFAGVPAADIADIEKLTTVIEYPADHIIFAEGDPADALYVVLRGQVAMRCCNRWGQEQTLVTLEARAILGEVALLTDEPRGATAVTVADTTVLRLTHEAFMTLLKQGSGVGQQILYNLARGLASRFGEVSQRLMRLLADQSQVRITPAEDELDELRRKLFTEWKF